MEKQSNHQQNEKGKNFIDIYKEIPLSIKEHLSPSYRKQYNIRRFISCFVLFFILRYMQSGYNNSLLSTKSIIPLLWAILAWTFWHYAFWRYQGGIIDNFSQNIVHFGSILSLIWKIIVQNFIILLWISLISPISGMKTWRKAVKHNKILFIDNQKNDIWN